MEDVTFSSANELYNRLKPALDTKCTELKRSGITYVTSDDIWNYLKNNVWNNSYNLRLFRMVDDILNADNILIDDYIKQMMSSKERTLYFSGRNEEDINDKKNDKK